MPEGSLFELIRIPSKMGFEFWRIVWLNRIMIRIVLFLFLLSSVLMAQEDNAQTMSAPAPQEALPVDESSKPVEKPSKEFQYDRDERVKNEDGTETVIWRETDEQRKMPYDPYRRFEGDSAKGPKTRWRDIDRQFPEARKEEAEAKAKREARPEEEKERERKLLDRTPVLQDKINPTIKERGSIPKRF